MVATTLAAALLFALAIRDDFTPSPTPTAPQFVVEVAGASVGSEINESGVFWTIDEPSASITVTNTTGEDAASVVRFRLVDGPCGRGQSVELESAAGPETVHIPPGGSADVVLDGIALGSFGETLIGLEPTAPACTPFATDPRSIAFQIFELDAAGT